MTAGVNGASTGFGRPTSRSTAPALTPRERFDRLWTAITETGCWVWLGSTVINSSGTPYGQFRMDGRKWLAHRAALVLDGHDLRPPGKHPAYTRVVHHHCRNTLCVNPAHLSVVPQSTNTRMAWMIRQALKRTSDAM